MFWSSFVLLRESTRILLEVSPEEPSESRAGDAGRAATSSTCTTSTSGRSASGFPSLSAHVLVDPGADCHAIRLELATMLRERFDLEHTTLQVEHAPAHARESQLPIAR